MLKNLSALFLWASAILFGQSTSSLRGTIKDPTGAVVTDSAVTLTDASNGSFRSVLSDKTGTYQILQVTPGNYTLKVEKPGFSVLVKNNITLAVDVPATVDCVLEIGSVGSTVNVEADASQINTVDGSLGNAFAEKQIKELPLQTRNVVELLSIQPGVTQTGEVLGARRDQNNVTLDGVDVNNNQNSGISSALVNGTQTANGNTKQNVAGFNAALPVPLDSVEEFRVTVAGQSADQGRSSGGQVTLITKSGTNKLHGTLYEYNRNTMLAANDFFNNQAGVARSPLVRNQFGASIGGPIIKNRIFLFGNWERRIDASSMPETATVPSATLRQGLLVFGITQGTAKSVQTLGPAAVQAIDPLHIGFSPAMREYLNSFPQGNDPSFALDAGLNFNGLRFNAPLDLDQSAYVAKMDFNIDQARKHTLSVRGTLNSASQDLTPGQYPGQAAAQMLLDNSKGIAANYTWIVKPTMINVATFGITRLGLNESGTLGTALQFAGITPTQNFGTSVRPSIQIMPTTTIGDDFTWTRGTNTITTGINYRFIRNTHTNYANSFASYSFNRNTLGGLGGDADVVVLNYLSQNGAADATLSQKAAVETGLGDLLGLVNQYGATYQYTKSGTVLPFGTPATREYAVNSYEQYVMDTWRFSPTLTITAGLRYSNASTPWEVNGTEVATTVPLEQYFAERTTAANQGIPNNQLANAALTYTLAGPANGKPGWYQRAKLNLGPRLSAAYAPANTDNWFKKIMGKGSVLRGGFAMVYDQYGNDMVYNIDQSGSPGLASSVTQPVNTNFTNSARYAGASSLPALPVAPVGGFPFTPPTITGGFNEGVGVASNLKAPYSLVFNANYARQIPGKLTVEVGYAGRFYRRGLLQQDVDQPLTTFTDPKSGTTWTQAVGVLHGDYLSAGQKYGPVAPVPFIEDVFPGLANAYVSGSATQNYYQSWIVQNGLSDLDNLNQMDRQRITGTNKCYSITGCNTFYPLQAAGLPTWTNSGYSDYNAATLSIRRSLANGFAFDFNYTLAHSIDNSSGAESGAGNSGAILQDAFNVNAFRGSSDFDIRHNITADALYELPFGKGRKLFSGANGVVDSLIGGWQISTIFRYHSGLPSTISAAGSFPTNYEISALVDLIPGSSNNFGNFTDNKGQPSLFANTSAAGNYFQQVGGATGTRAILRLPGFTNFDISLMKTFRLPWEGHRLQLRGEAFNAFNHVNFYNPVLDMNSTSTFGEFRSASPGRVVQLSLRYAF